MSTLPIVKANCPLPSIIYSRIESIRMNGEEEVIGWELDTVLEILSELINGL